MDDRQRTERAFIEIAAYLASAASLSAGEPPSYGNLRLLEGVQRVLDALIDLDIADGELRTLASGLGEEVTGSSGDVERSQALADRLVAALVARLEAGPAG